jgi:hypothetical protein
MAAAQPFPQWPTSEQVMQAINAYHSANLAMDHAYDALSQEEKKVVPAPP